MHWNNLTRQGGEKKKRRDVWNCVACDKCKIEAHWTTWIKGYCGKSKLLTRMSLQWHQCMGSGVHKMPEDWKRPEASGVKRRVVIWLTEAPFSRTVLINVTKQHNEDSSCFPHCIYQRGEGRRERGMDKQNQVPGWRRRICAAVDTSPRSAWNSNRDMEWRL